MILRGQTKLLLESIYTIEGKKVTEMQHGLNIVKLANGKVRKEDPSKPEEEVKHSNLPAEGVKELSVTQPSLEVTTEPIVFNTIRRENSLLPKGKEQVVSEGKDGQVMTYVEVDGSDRKVV